MNSLPSYTSISGKNKYIVGVNVKVLSNIIENREALLTIELESAEVENHLQKSYAKIVKKTNIPGFRKGKAPRTVLEQHIGRDGLLEDALNILIPEAYKDAIKQQDVKPFAQPSIKLLKKEPVTFEARIPLPPITKLGDYNKIKMKPEKIKIKEEKINSIIEELRQRNAQYKPINRPVKSNDLVTIDVKGCVNNETIIDQKEVAYHVTSGLTYPAPGFPEQLLNMKKDKEKQFNLTLSKNYPKKELAEKEAQFSVKINEIKEEILPEVDDDFAKNIEKDIKNVGDLKKRIHDSLKSSAEEAAKVKFEDMVIETLIEKSMLEYPGTLVEAETNNLVAQHLQKLRMNAKDDIQYQQILKNMSKDELMNRYRPLAIKRVNSSLVLQKVAESENIEVKDKEIDSEIELMIQNAGENKDEQRKYFNTPENRDYIKNVIITRKTVQRLTQIVQGKKTENKIKEAK
jgi:trigger factor